MSKSNLLKGMAIMLVIMLAFVGVVWAASATIYSPENAAPFSVVTFATTTTGETTGPGATAATSFGVPMADFSCALVYTGVTPSTSTYTLQGSNDNTLWRDISTAITTTLAAGNYVDVTDKQSTYARANWSILTKATGTTTATMKCLTRQH